MERLPAVITPLNIRMGLDIARSLGRRGIPVYGIDPDPREPSGKSKYCQLIVCPDPHESEEDYVQFLVDWGKKLGSKAVLYPISDVVVLLCSRERQRLEPYYEWVVPDHSTIVKLLTKEGLVAAARECDILAPQTIIPRDVREVEATASHLIYPVILKPIQSDYWYTPQIASMLREGVFSGKAKVWLCNNPAELVQAYRDIAQHDDRIVIQEVIPGPEESLIYISFYLNRQSEPLAIFAGRKLRVLPIGFGSASYARSFYDLDVEEITLKLLSRAHYRGLGGLELKKDTRDDNYKLIEFNTRFGLWDGLGVHCGVDTAYIAYCDALRLPVEPQLTYREGVIWVDWERDIRAFWMYRKRGLLTLRQWLRSLQGEKMVATYTMNDCGPGFAAIIDSLRLLWNGITSRQS